MSKMVCCGSGCSRSKLQIYVLQGFSHDVAQVSCLDVSPLIAVGPERLYHSAKAVIKLQKHRLIRFFAGDML